MKIMQRFLLSLVVLFIGSQLLAQSIEDIEAQFAKGEFDKAKTAVDNFLAKEKNQSKADGWWYKGVVYNEIAKSEKYKSLVTDGRMDAFNAFKKYYELDAKAVRATLEQHVRLFDIYNGYFDNAVASFSGQKFEDAYNGFKNALTVEEYIAGKGYEYNGFKFSAFDTTLVQNIALSAYRAEKHDEAVVYYKRIADQRIAGKDNVDVYHLLIEYYQKKNDKATREKYLQLGRELYPDEPRWYQMELEEVDEKDKKALFAKYEELLPKYPNTYILHYNYAVELFNYSLSDPKPDDVKEVQAKFETIINKAIAIDKTHAEPSFLIAGYYYNMIYDIQDEQRAIKTNTAADQKKKADIKTRMVAASDKMIPYAQTAFDMYNAKATLKPSEKGSFKKVAGYLATAYEVKGDKAKSDEYTKKQDSIQ
jgi:tetratricopeptide (TPR) repeat protein